MTEISALAETIWDAIVVGAGPAGAASATLLADRGWKVLLIEKSKWPRGKACGGCVNADAIATLQRMNLHCVLHGAATTDRVAIRSSGRQVIIQSCGSAISRAKLDERLVTAAVARGARFLPATAATLCQDAAGTPVRCVRLQHGDQTAILSTCLVLACDGINGTLLKDEPWAAWKIASNAWLGVSATLPASAAAIEPREVCMNIGVGGYVGLVRQADGQLHLGAALDPIHCRRLGGPSQMISEILLEHGVTLPESLVLQGTGLLTRHRPHVGGHRVLCVGDACGYVEPFTGEGIAWALASAEAVVSLLPSDLSDWPRDLPRCWKRLHSKTVSRRQRICRAVRFAVRRPWLWRSAARVATLLPAAVDWIAPHPHPTLAGDLND